MSRFQKYLLRKLIRYCCVQGYQFRRMNEFFSIVIQEVNIIFYEDNMPTTKSFLTERLEDAYDHEINNMEYNPPTLK